MPAWTTPVPVPPADPHGHDPDQAPRYALLPHEALKQLVQENAAIAEGNIQAGALPRVGLGNAAQEYEFGPPDLPGPDDYLPSHGRKA